MGLGIICDLKTKIISLVLKGADIKKFHIQRDAPEKYNYLIGRNKWATAGMC